MKLVDISDAARRLLERAGGNERVPSSVAAAASTACDELVERLAVFIGQAGARALFDRSIVLTAREHPWLKVTISPDATQPSARLRS